jgi:hypothetical protein
VEDAVWGELVSSFCQPVDTLAAVDKAVVDERRLTPVPKIKQCFQHGSRIAPFARSTLIMSLP